MTAALTPARALEYLGTLSTDIRACAVMDRGGATLAGDEALAAAAAGALERAPGGLVAREDLAAGTTLMAARTETHAVAVEAGPHHLPSLLELDLRNVLADLAL